MSKDVEWKLRQQLGVLGVEAEGCAVQIEEKSMKGDCNFSHRWDLVVAGAAWKPPVCCTLERCCFLFMSKKCGLEAETGA